MNGKSPSLPNLRLVLLLALGGATLLASGCVKYKAHIEVTPDGKLEITERAEAMPGTMDSLHVDPRLAWTAFEATVGSRAGHFTKDRPDSLAGATGKYELDSWNELGQRGQAFKGIDEGEKRLNPAQAGLEGAPLPIECPGGRSLRCGARCAGGSRDEVGTSFVGWGSSRSTNPQRTLRLRVSCVSVGWCLDDDGRSSDLNPV